MRTYIHQVLYDVFPKHVAEALMNGQKVPPERKDMVTVYFRYVRVCTRVCMCVTSDMCVYVCMCACMYMRGMFIVSTVECICVCM